MCPTFFCWVLPKRTCELNIPVLEHCLAVDLMPSSHKIGQERTQMNQLPIDVNLFSNQNADSQRVIYSNPIGHAAPPNAKPPDPCPATMFVYIFAAAFRDFSLPARNTYWSQQKLSCTKKSLFPNIGIQPEKPLTGLGWVLMRKKVAKGK